MEDKELFGKLFNSVPLLTENHLETLLNTLDKERSVYLLVQAVKHAYHLGVFSIGESEVISKCIRILSKTDEDSESQ
jgi:hypothetical protein